MKKSNSLKNPLVRILSFFYWIKINNPPRWVLKATRDYEYSYSRKYGHPPYDVKKKFYGSNYIYKVFFETYEQGRYNEIFYVKKKYFSKNKL